jgi:hypothetical protein
MGTSRQRAWRDRGAAISVVAVALAAVPLLPAAATTPPLTDPPVIDGDWPDPDLVADPASGRWYSYATNFTIFGFAFNVPTKSSDDLVDWSTFHGDALPELPAWATPGHTWAPAAAHISGRWVLYFTARHTASGRQCIGVAVASDPVGPFAPVGDAPIVCQTDLGGSIDASPFYDAATGRWWLHWKSDQNAPGVADPAPRIWAAPLAHGGTALGAAPVVVLTTTPDDLGIVEAPEMVRVPAGYRLLYAGSDWSTAGYFGHWASCAGPAGPCSRPVPASDPLLGPGSGLAGPGAMSVAALADGRWVVLFHAWREAVGYDAGGRRATHAEVLTFDGPGGAPRLRPDLPATGPPPAGQHASGPLPTDPPLSGDAAWPGYAVDRLYRAVLGRPAEPAGLAYAVAGVEQGWTLQDVAHRLLTSSEHAAGGDRSDDELVTAAYAGAMGRPPTAEELDAALALLEDGRSIEDVVVVVVLTTEAQERSAPASTSGAVQRLYLAAFLRPGEPAGLYYWDRHLRRGTPIEVIAASFSSQPEFRVRYDRLTDRGFVEAFYRNVLGRDGEPSGVAHWTGVLRRGFPRYAIVLFFADSPEMRARSGIP